MITTNQNPVKDTQKIKRKEPIQNTQENYKGKDQE